MEIVYDGKDIFWVYKGKKLNIKYDHEEIIQMFNDYRRQYGKKNTIAKVINDSRT